MRPLRIQYSLVATINSNRRYFTSQQRTQCFKKHQQLTRANAFKTNNAVNRQAVWLQDSTKQQPVRTITLHAVVHAVNGSFKYHMFGVLSLCLCDEQRVHILPLNTLSAPNSRVLVYTRRHSFLHTFPASLSACSSPVAFCVFSSSSSSFSSSTNVPSSGPLRTILPSHVGSEHPLCAFS